MSRRNPKDWVPCNKWHKLEHMQLCSLTSKMKTFNVNQGICVGCLTQFNLPLGLEIACTQYIYASMSWPNPVLNLEQSRERDKEAAVTVIRSFEFDLECSVGNNGHLLLYE